MRKDKKKSKEVVIQTSKGPAKYGEERLSNGRTISWIRWEEEKDVVHGDS